MCGCAHFEAMCRGLLIRGGDILEAAASIDTVAFDKTGTLTVGKPSIAALSVTGQPPQPGHPDRQLLAHAAALERQSTHPLASAVLAAAAAAGKTLLYMPAQHAAEAGSTFSHHELQLAGPQMQAGCTCADT